MNDNPGERNQISLSRSSADDPTPLLEVLSADGSPKMGWNRAAGGMNGIAATVLGDLPDVGDKMPMDSEEHNGVADQLGTLRLLSLNQVLRCRAAAPTPGSCARRC